MVDVEGRDQYVCDGFLDWALTKSPAPSGPAIRPGAPTPLARSPLGARSSTAFCATDTPVHRMDVSVDERRYLLAIRTTKRTNLRC